MVALVLCVCGLNYGLPKALSSAILSVPLIPLLVIEVGITLSAALLFYDEADPLQTITLSLVMLLLVAIFAWLTSIANPLVFSQVSFRPGSQAPVVSINWVFLLTVNASAISVSKALLVLSGNQQGGRKRTNSQQSDR